LRVAADACGSDGGTGVVLEEHAVKKTAKARIPDLTSASRV
jgi:hypothetical protein